MQVWVDRDEIVELMEDLGIDISSWIIGSHAKLDRAILRAQREFERRTKRKYEKTDVTQKLNGTGKETIVLKQYPANSITSIKIIDLPNYHYALTVSEYRLEIETGIVTLVATYPFTIAFFPIGKYNIEVEYNYGYEVVDIPEDIKDCIIMMSLLRILERQVSELEPQGLASIRIGQFQMKYNQQGGVYSSQKSSLNDSIKIIIENYRKTLVF